MKRYLLLPAVCVLLTTTSAVAQQSSHTLLAQAEPGHYLVYFPLGQSTLDAEAKATVSAAAQEFQRTGSASITVQGHTDTSGNADFNQALSERREQAVSAELVRLGVPATAISGSATGETQLAVPTGDGVREAQNRRVEIAVAPPPPPPPPAPAPAPQPQVVEAPPPPPAAKNWFLTAGGFYGYNFEDENGHDSQLGGINLGLDYDVTPWLALGVEQAGFYHFDTENDGFGGRSAASINLLGGGEGDIVPYVGGNIGYLYGSGFDDDFFAGPEIGVSFGMFNAKVAYDIPFNRDLDEGIVNTTVGVGFRF
ncbi:MAG TPA: OmpA family protein [Dongiaceae bacterium]|nr:OmpA family protein [Dongiaceae bacterium]